MSTELDNLELDNEEGIPYIYLLKIKMHLGILLTY